MGTQSNSRLTGDGSRRNLVWLLAEHGARLISALLIGVWVARYLGPEDFGYLSWVVAGFSVVAVTAKLGFENIFVREVVRNPVESESLAASAVVARLVVAVVIILAALVAANLASGTGMIYAALLALGLIPGVTEVLAYRFQARKRAEFLTLCRLVQLTVSCAVRVWLIVSGAGLAAFFYALILDEVVMAMALLVVHRVHFGSWLGSHPLRSHMSHLIGESWPLLLSSLAVILYMRMDQLMLGVLLDEAAVGIYSAGVRVVEGIYFLPMVVATAYFPALLQARAVSGDIYEARLRRLMTGNVWSAMVIAATLSLGAGLIIGVLFGDGYLGAIPVLRVQALNVVFLAMGAVAGKWLYVEGLQVVHFGKTLVGLIINFVLNLWWIPSFGGVGAAWAAVVSQAVAYFLVFAFIGSCRRIFWIQLASLSPLQAWAYLNEIRRARS